MRIDFSKFVFNKLLGFLDDVSLGTLSSGDLLSWDGEKWANKQLPSINDYSDKEFYNTSKSSSSETYLNYLEYNNANNGVVGNYCIGIKFLYNISSSSYYLKYRIKINGNIVEERKLYVPNSDGDYQFCFEYKHTTTVKDENIKVEIDFLVEQPFWGVTTGTIIKAIVSKELL